MALKPILNSDGMSFGYESKDPQGRHHRHKVLPELRFTTVLPPVKLAQLKPGWWWCSTRGWWCSTRVFASKNSSSSSSVNKSKKLLNEEERGGGGGGDGVVEEIMEEAEFDKDELASFRGLVLDISYRPVNVVCWKRAICLEFMEKADVLEYYDQTVNSPNGSFYIPAVLRVPHLLQVVKRRRIKSTLSRKNILYRDSFTCQFCRDVGNDDNLCEVERLFMKTWVPLGINLTKYCSSCENLTIDHVVPIARGGEWTWENLVTACAKCNSRKGQKTVEEANMKLMKVPKAPKDYDILAIPLTNTAIRMLRMRQGTPEEWRQYLSKLAP